MFVNHPPVAFAGADTTVCEGPIQLAGQAQNASSVSWSTLGDGAFTVTGIPNPIYFPGPGDISSGQVQLVFSATALTPCQDTVYDTLTLAISPKPIADVGPDSLICFWEIPYHFNALTHGYSSLEWTTSGDGYFDDPTSPTASYYPGEGDKQALSVVLTLTAYPLTPCPNPAIDQMTLLLDPCVGIEEPMTNTANLNIEPNPNKGAFTLTLDKSVKGNVVLSIVNGQGQEVYRELIAAEKLQQYPVDIKGAAPGSYLIKVVQGKTQITRKFIVH
jgi:hypothetical protein